jgi:hypothetical protein
MKSAREEELEEALQKSARAGMELLEKLKTSEENEKRLRDALEQKMRLDEQGEEVQKEFEALSKKNAQLLDKHEELVKHHNQLLLESQEQESEVEMLEKENVRLTNALNQSSGK